VVKSTSENALQNKAKTRKAGSKKRLDRKSSAQKSARVRAAKSPARARSTHRAVFLVGFMGAGKSSVGRALGQRLNWIFEDLDDHIERREGQRVAHIFRDCGEEAFRQAETSALQHVLGELRSGAAKIVALGGGAFAQEANFALLKASGVPTIFLDAPVGELWQRCSKQANENGVERPLLKSMDQFRKLYASRRRRYMKASFKIETGKRTIDEIAAEIVNKLALKSITLRRETGEAE
jgi:shikimate kinase